MQPLAAPPVTEQSDPVGTPCGPRKRAAHVVNSSFYGALGVLPQLAGRAGLGLAIPLLLQPEAYGQYTFFVWLMTILIQLTTAGLPQAAQRFIPKAESPAQGFSVALFLIKTAMTGTALGLFIFLCWAFVAPRAWLIGTASVAVLVLAVLTGSFSTVCSGILKGYERFASVAFGETISQALRLGALGILWLYHAPLTVVMLFSLEPLYWAVQGLYLFRKFSEQRVPAIANVGKLEKADIFKYAGSVAFVALFDLAVWQRMEIAFLVHYKGPKEAGIFNLAVQISTLLMVLPSAAVSALFPSFSSLYASDPQRLRKVYSTAATLLWIFVFPMLAVGLCLMPPLIVRVYGTSYEQVTAILPFVLMPRAFLLVGGIGSTLVYATGKQRYLMGLCVFGAGLSALGNFLLVPRFGLIGAGVSVAITQPIIAVLTLLIVQRTLLPAIPILTRTVFIGLSATAAGALLSTYGWHIAGAALIAAAYAAACYFDPAVSAALTAASTLLERLWVSTREPG